MKLKNKIIINLFWRFAERCGSQVVSFVVSIIIARMLAPEAYGTIALITVFTTILNIFVDSGLANALIQKKDADDIDFSTVFFTNIAFCIVLYAGMFFCAPLIASFYGDGSLVSLIRILSLTIVVSGVKNVQQAYVSKTMQFKRFFFSTLGGTVGAAVIGISMAYAGFGVWTLVAQQLFNIIFDTAILWITVKWRPKKAFSLSRLKGLFNYGGKLLASSLIDTGYNELRQLIIGKLYNSTNLAYYNQGQKLPGIIIVNVNDSIDSVMLPAMSEQQSNTDRVKEMTRRALKMSTYIISPIMMGMFFVATPMIRLILTEKWLPCVPYLRIFCVVYMFHPIHTANLNAIKAMGQSNLILKMEIWKKIIDMIILITAMWFGVMAIAYSLLISSVINQIMNSWPNRKLLNYGYTEQLKDILPNILLATVMGIVVGLVTLLGFTDTVTLAIQLVLGAVIYIGGSAVLKIDSFNYLCETVKSMKNNLQK